MANHEYPDTPRIAVGAVVMKNDRLLLVCRGKPPSEGEWAVPGGSVELGETLREATEREILEETGLTIKVGDPVSVLDVISRDDAGQVRFHYVIVEFLADYVDGELMIGYDASDAQWVKPCELEELPVTNRTLDFLRRLKFIG